MDFLADSQQSQELFDPVGSQESAEPLPPLTVTAPTPAMSQAQVKEQKALKEEVKKLTGQGQQKNVSKNISIEGSPIEHLGLGKRKLRKLRLRNYPSIIR